MTCKLLSDELQYLCNLTLKCVSLDAARQSKMLTYA